MGVGLVPGNRPVSASASVTRSVAACRDSDSTGPISAAATSTAPTNRSPPARIHDPARARTSAMIANWRVRRPDGALGVAQGVDQPVIRNTLEVEHMFDYTTRPRQKQPA